MSDQKSDAKEERSKKLKELAIEELRTMTYHSKEDEFDPERTHALVKVISKEEYVPDAYKADTFYKRFQTLHSDLFTNAQTQNNEKDVVQNQELDGTSPQNEELNQEIEEKLATVKKLDEEIKRLSKHKKIMRFFMAASVLLMFFGLNIVTYASGKPSVFQLVEQAVNHIKIKATGSEYIANHDNTENDVEYQIGIERNISDIVDYSEVSNYFNRTIYLPSILPEIIVTGDVTYMEVNGICKAYVNYDSEDHKAYLQIELYEANRGEEDSDTAFFEGSIYSEYPIRIANSREVLCAYESETYNMAYLIFNDVLYIFKYNLPTEQVINTIETMETY